MGFKFFSLILSLSKKDVSARDCCIDAKQSCKNIKHLLCTNPAMCSVRSTKISCPKTIPDIINLRVQIQTFFTNLIHYELDVIRAIL